MPHFSKIKTSRYASFSLLVTWNVSKGIFFSFSLHVNTWLLILLNMFLWVISMYTVHYSMSFGLLLRCYMCVVLCVLGDTCNLPKIPNGTSSNVCFISARVPVIYYYMFDLNAPLSYLISQLAIEIIVVPRWNHVGSHYQIDHFVV